MTNIFSKISSIKLPRRRRENKKIDFNQDHKGAIECPRCHNVHFKKHWYVSRSKLADVLELGEAANLDKALCPACTMIKERTFEGEVFLEEFPAHFLHELLSLVRNFGLKATEMDPQSRVIEIRKIHNGYYVTTTENQLAVKLAKKVKDSFNSVEIDFSYSSEPAKVARVRVMYMG